MQGYLSALKRTPRSNAGSEATSSAAITIRLLNNTLQYKFSSKLLATLEELLGKFEVKAIDITLAKLSGKVVSTGFIDKRKVLEELMTHQDCVDAGMKYVNWQGT